MKKILLFAVLSLLFFGCGDDDIIRDNDSKGEGNDNTDDIENFYDKYCYGFIVNDTIGLQVMGKSNSNNNIILSGRKDDKLWVALFDSNTKSCIKEYISNNVFPSSHFIHIGHGEMKEYSITEMEMVDFYETDNGFASKVHCNNQIIGYMFCSKDCKNYFFRPQNSSASSRLFKWFNNSYIARINLSTDYATNDAYTCFSIDGDTLFTKKSNLFITDISFPINYDDFVQFYKMYNFDEKNIRPCVSVLKYGLREDTNCEKTDIYILSNENDDFEISYKERNENYLDFELSVNKNNGEKDIVSYRLDLENWDFEIID